MTIEALSRMEATSFADSFGLAFAGWPGQYQISLIRFALALADDQEGGDAEEAGEEDSEEDEDLDDEGAESEDGESEDDGDDLEEKVDDPEDGVADDGADGMGAVVAFLVLEVSDG